MVTKVYTSHSLVIERSPGHKRPKQDGPKTRVLKPWPSAKYGKRENEHPKRCRGL